MSTYTGLSDKTNLDQLFTCREIYLEPETDNIYYAAEFKGEAPWHDYEDINQLVLIKRSFKTKEILKIVNIGQLDSNKIIDGSWVTQLNMSEDGNFIVLKSSLNDIYIFDRNLNFIYKSLFRAGDIKNIFLNRYLIINHGDGYSNAIFDIINRTKIAILDIQNLLNFNYKNNYLYAGHESGKVYRFDFSTIGVIEGDLVFTVSYTDKLNIESSISGLAEIKIYNMTGGLITQFPEQFITEGHNPIIIDELAIGTYLYNIKINGIEFTGKFLRM